VEGMIASGRVRVNGEVARLGRRVDPAKDEVEVDGSRVPLASDLVYFLMNKPVGVVTSAADPQGRTTVMDFLDAHQRVWPVGRLDAETEGALLLTNDGELTFRLTHPSYEVPKTYLAEVSPTLSRGQAGALARGIRLDDGPTRPAAVRILETSGGRSLVEITISEGRNRQVRRMFEAIGTSVVRLARTGIGPLMLGRLKPGTYRRLRPEEVRALYRACDL
jgi:23S rRNA pseudouridine2605 synthase